MMPGLPCLAFGHRQQLCPDPRGHVLYEALVGVGHVHVHPDDLRDDGARVHTGHGDVRCDDAAARREKGVRASARREGATSRKEKEPCISYNSVGG